MLSVVTETALLRRWPPSLYARLCSQLQDSTDQHSAATEYLMAQLQQPQIPLFYEYVLELCLEPKSLLSIEKLLKEWSQENWRERSDATRKVIAYIAKGLDRAETFEFYDVSANCILQLATQASEGCIESEFFLCKLGQAPVAAKLLESIPSFSDELSQVGARFSEMYGCVGERRDTRRLSYTPGRTFRLLWLNEFIGSCILYPGEQLVQEQLEIMWPNEKIVTLVFELSLTSFDAYASALELKTQVSVWSCFITKKLPLVLRVIAKDQSLDSALTRLLTTMDKEVAAVVDAVGARIEFTRACIDLGICDPSVLHALHKSYQPQPEDLNTILGIPVSDLNRLIAQETPYASATVIKLVNSLPQLKPQAQELVSQELHKFVRNPRASVRLLAYLSTALLAKPELSDHLFMHVPTKYFLGHLVKRLQTLSTTSGQLQFYGEMGSILAYVRFALNRYDIFVGINEQETHWAYKILFQEGASNNFEEMSIGQQSLLGAWIKAVSMNGGVANGGVASGPGPECLKSVAEVFDILPALIKQLALALENEVLALDTLKQGLQVFLHPSRLSLLPIILKSLFDDLWSQLNIKSNTAILRFILAGIQGDSPEHLAAMNSVAPLIERHEQYVPRELREAVVARCGQYEFPSLQPKGSFFAALQTALKNLAQWQLEPIGVPLVDSRLYEMGIKYFGKEEIMRLVAQLPESSVSTEIQVAMLVVYCARLVKQVNSLNLIPQGIFSEEITELATRYVERFQAIYEKHLDIPEEPVVQEEAPPIFTQVVPEPQDTSFSGFDMDAPMGLDELDDAMNVDFFD